MALIVNCLKTISSSEEWQQVTDELERVWNLPHAVGALDGDHTTIRNPKIGGSNFHNYKGFNSTNLMAICDAKYDHMVGIMMPQLLADLIFLT